MLLLAIDTSTTAITVGLHDGASVVAESTTLDARAHAEHLAPNIRAALASADAEPGDVTDVVVGIGPGPSPVCASASSPVAPSPSRSACPVRGLTSLDAIAHEAWLGGRRGDLLVATDARRKEVYAATYVLGDAGACRVSEPVVSRAADLPAEVRALPAAGRGPSLYADALSACGVAPRRERGSARRPRCPSSAARARRHRQVSCSGSTPGHGFDGLEPLYLRRPDAAPAPPSTKSTLG